MLNLDMFNEHAIEERRECELEELNMIGGDETSQATQVVRSEEKIGRNDPCPCGSGKKYKKCCGS
jgi:preprotein translocase subunit SecA